MMRRKLSRRHMLALGLGGMTLPAPLVAARRAVAQMAPETVVYVSNAGTKTIGVFAMDRDTGALAPIDTVAVPGTDKPSPASMPMAVTPDRQFIFAALRSDNFPASSFAIDHATGRLAHVATTPLADSMAYIITDRAGRFLLAASYPGNKLTVNPIDADGRIVEKTTQVIPNRPKSHCILVDAENKYCYATSLGADIVMEWKFDPAAGTLSPNGPGEVHTKPGAGPRHMALHPSGGFLYLITETTDTIGAYAIDPAAGTLTELQFVDALAAGLYRAARRRRPAHDAGRAVSVRQRAQDQHLGRISHRPGKRHPVADRALADRKDPARLQHRPARPFPAVGRARFKRDDGLPHRPAIGRLDACKTIPDGQNAKLDRDRRPALVSRTKRSFDLFQKLLIRLTSEGRYLRPKWIPTLLGKSIQ